MTPAIKQLEAAAIEFQVIHYQLDTAADGENLGIAAATAMNLPAAKVFKTLIAELDTGALVVCIVPVASTLKLKSLSKAAHVKSALIAKHKVAQRSTGYQLGGISPFGQRKRLPTFIDEQALNLDVMYVSGGKRGLELRIAPQDLVRCCDASVCALTSEH